MQIIYSYFKSVLSDCVPSWTTPTWGLREQLLLILVSIYSRHVHIDYEWVQCWLWENNAKKLFCSDWRGKFCFFLNLNFYKWCLILKDKTLFWKTRFFFRFFSWSRLSSSTYWLLWWTKHKKKRTRSTTNGFVNGAELVWLWSKIWITKKSYYKRKSTHIA